MSVLLSYTTNSSYLIDNSILIYACVSLIICVTGEKHILCVSVIEQWLLLLAHLMGVSKVSSGGDSGGS